MPCLVRECPTLGENHHVKAKGCGGRDRDQVPICHAHHMEGETIGWERWQEEHGIDLRFAAELLHRAWHKPRPPPEGE